MYLSIQKVKYLLAVLLSASLAWGAIQLNSVVYDLIVNIDDTNVVQDFNPEGGLTYYEPLVFTTTTGGDFEFNNYSSKLTNNVTDTSLLIYDNLQANLIVDEPWAINDGAGIGFGGGQENKSNEKGTQESEDTKQDKETVQEEEAKENTKEKSNSSDESKEEAQQESTEKKPQQQEQQETQQETKPSKEAEAVPRTEVLPIDPDIVQVSPEGPGEDNL